MKKLILMLFAVMGLVLAAVQPAKAVEPLGAGVLALITIGSHVVADKVRDGTLPAAPPVCRMEKVKAENGNYFFEVVAKDNPANCR